MLTVMLVDDEPAIHRIVGTLLELMGGIRVLVCVDGRAGLETALAERPQLIVADIHLPVLDGLSLTRLVRANAAIAHTPIMLLTGHVNLHDRYAGFLHGADDFMLKPFDATEFQLRVRALMRRANVPVAPARLEAGALVLEPLRLAGRVGETEVRFTASEFAILRCLVLRTGQLVSVETLLIQALDYPAGTGNPQVVHTHVKNIRAKLRGLGLLPLPLTSSRRGYTLQAAGG